MNKKTTTLLVINLIIGAFLAIIYTAINGNYLLAVVSAKVTPAFNDNTMTLTQYVDWAKEATKLYSKSIVFTCVGYAIYSIINVVIAKFNKQIILLVITILSLLPTLYYAYKLMDMMIF